MAARTALGSLRSRGRATRLGSVRTLVGILAVSLAVPACSGGGTKSPPSPKPPTLKVTSLTATLVGGGEVDLHWTTSGKNVYGYVLSRNGKYVNLLQGRTDYTDYDVRPKQTYTYSLMVQDTKGKTSAPVTASATMPKPPRLDRAHPDGSYDVRFTFLSETYTNRAVGDKYGEKWILVPKCGKGPCKVVVKMGRRGEGHPILGPKGTVYSGAGSDKESTCDNQPLQESITITIRVTRATFQKGVWTVAAFQGTEKRNGPAALGCVGGSATLSIDAHRIGPA